LTKTLDKGHRQDTEQAKEVLEALRQVQEQVAAAKDRQSWWQRLLRRS
jgi:hypothetical protein